MNKRLLVAATAAVAVTTLGLAPAAQAVGGSVGLTVEGPGGEGETAPVDPTGAVVPTAEELAAAPARLDALVAAHAPAVVAVLGVTAYRQAFGRPKAALGEQETPWPGTRLFVAPNPSGLNAHETTASLARAYAAPAAAAGLLAGNAR